MRYRWRQFDDAAPPVDRIGDASQDSRVAELLRQTQRAAHRYADGDAERTDR